MGAMSTYASSGGSMRDARFLVASANPQLQSFIRLILAELRSLSVRQASDGVQAVGWLAKEPFDIVVLDYDILDEDWLDRLRSLRSGGESDLSAAFVLMVSDRHADMADRAEKLGMFKVLRKPFGAFELRDTIADAFTVAGMDSIYGEKRRVHRLNVGVSAFFSSEPKQELKTWDLSHLGAFVVTQEPPPVNSPVTLVLELPHLAEPLRARGTIVSIRSEPAGEMPAGCGVSFDHLDDVQMLRDAFTSPV